MNLNEYKLTLPVSSSGKLSGDAAEVLNLEGYNSKWFKQTDKELIFTVEDKGALTPSAKYPRSELRHLKEFTANDRASDELTFKVTKLEVGHKVVVQQIHGGNEPWIKMVYTETKDGGEYKALVKTTTGGEDVTVQLLTGIKLGEAIVSDINFFPAKAGKRAYIRITVNGGVPVRVYLDRKDKGKAYFKRGAYYQNNAGKGFVCEVRHLI